LGDLYIGNIYFIKLLIYYCQIQLVIHFMNKISFRSY